MKNIRKQEYTAEFNELAVKSDITYLWTDERWLYPATVRGLLNSAVAGWSLKPHMMADIVTIALTTDRSRWTTKSREKHSFP